MVASAAQLVTGVFFLFLVPAPKDVDTSRTLAALEQKMLGEWEGQGGCDGRFVFRFDGTYDLTSYGPAGSDTKGTWKLRWDTLPPTLVLTCKISQLEEEVGTTLELKLIKLDDKNLAIEYPSPNGLSGKYARETK